MAGVKELLDRLVAACALEGDDALLAFRTRLRPAEGDGAKVMPPTCPPLRSGELPLYVMERRFLGGEPGDTVLLDSFQSQANRVETEVGQELRHASVDDVSAVGSGISGG